MIDLINELLRPFNESRFLVALTMIFLNIGSKYIDLGFSRTQEQALRDGLAREMLIFAISFMGTRDILTAFIMTGAFVVLSDMLLNENSKYCIISNKLNKIKAMMDLNNDGMISPEEEYRALQVLEAAKKQRLKDVQANFLSYLGETASPLYS